MLWVIFVHPNLMLQLPELRRCSIQVENSMRHVQMIHCRPLIKEDFNCIGCLRKRK